MKTFAKLVSLWIPRMGLITYTPICFTALDFNKHHSLPSFSLYPCISSTARYAVQFTLFNKSKDSAVETAKHH